MYLSHDSSGFGAVRKKRSKAYNDSFARTQARLKGKSPVYIASYLQTYRDQAPKMRRAMQGKTRAQRQTFADLFNSSLPAAMSSILMQEGAIPNIPSASFTAEYAPAGVAVVSPSSELAPSQSRQYPVVAVSRGKIVGTQNDSGELIDLPVANSEPSFFDSYKIPLAIAAGLAVIYVVI